MKANGQAIARLARQSAPRHLKLRDRFLGWSQADAGLTTAPEVSRAIGSMKCKCVEGIWENVLDQAREAPLSEPDYDKLKGALHVLVGMLAQPQARRRPAQRWSNQQRHPRKAPVRSRGTDAMAPRSCWTTVYARKKTVRRSGGELSGTMLLCFGDTGRYI